MQLDSNILAETGGHETLILAQRLIDAGQLWAGSRLSAYGPKKWSSKCWSSQHTYPLRPRHVT